MNATDIIIFIIVVLAALLNSALLFTLFKQRTNLQPKDVLLLNLTLSNFMQGFVAYPIELYTIWKKESTKSTECVISAMAVFLLSLVSIWTLTLSSVERLLSVKYPFVKERLLLHQKSLLILSVLSVWLISPFGQ